ncbi:methionine--tRNA ligase, partial [Candidatus Pacearchaeota archaeon]
MAKYLITSALPYANGPIHIGHVAGAYLPADIYTKFKKLKGEDAIHICGTDEHGVAITISAEKKGISPKELVDKYHKEIYEDFKKIGIEFDNFSRTTKPLHYKISQEIFLKLYEKGWFEERVVERFWCPKCRRFLPDRYIRGTCPYCGYEDAYGDQCESCGRALEPTDLINHRCAICSTPPVKKKTSHFYFLLSKLQPKIENWINTKRNFWKENVLKYVDNWLKQGLKDRPITRDLEWGIPVPLENVRGKVIYVWFEAPIGYISSTIEWAEKIGDKDKWKDYWKNPDSKIIHFIGKDNIVFHCITWPAMLMALGEYNLPWNVPANEFMNLHGQKISTSRNWAVWVKDLVPDFNPDFPRYYLTSIMPETGDSNFDYREFQAKVNNELVNILSNFIHRNLSFIIKYLNGKLPEKVSDLKSEDKEVINNIWSYAKECANNIENFRYKKALKNLIEIAIKGNQYFDYTKPWVLVKQDKKRLEEVLFVNLLIIKAISIAGYPFLPFGMKKVWKYIGISKPSWDDIFNYEIPENKILEKVEPVYKRIPDDLINKKLEKFEEKRIKFKDFEKLDLRIGEIKQVKEIKGADKLWHLKVDIGGKLYNVVAGIKKFY